MREKIFAGLAQALPGDEPRSLVLNPIPAYPKRRGRVVPAAGPAPRGSLWQGGQPR
jgi:hypothetical protein